ncbi:MAG: helix-turn-helix domain-containing protein [Flavobacteriales bacterium]|jgi:transcriptional regulator with XRE-family HTH domain
MKIINQNILPLRKALGATQKEFAELLGLTRPAVTLYESGERELPVRVRDRFVELHRWISSTEVTPAATASDGAPPHVIAKWQRSLKLHTHQLQKSEIMLRDAEQRYADAAASLLRLETFPAQNRAEQRWLGRLRRRHEATLRNNDLYVQMELRMRVESYRVRVGMLKGLLGI